MPFAVTRPECHEGRFAAATRGHDMTQAHSVPAFHQAHRYVSERGFGSELEGPFWPALNGCYVAPLRWEEAPCNHRLTRRPGAQVDQIQNVQSPSLVTEPQLCTVAVDEQPIEDGGRRNWDGYSQPLPESFRRHPAAATAEVDRQCGLVAGDP